jgi:hypothetical protein
VVLVVAQWGVVHRVVALAVRHTVVPVVRRAEVPHAAYSDGGNLLRILSGCLDWIPSGSQRSNRLILHATDGADYYVGHLNQLIRAKVEQWADCRVKVILTGKVDYRIAEYIQTVEVQWLERVTHHGHHA